MNHDEFAIRRLIEKWAVCRDGGDWDGLASVWHETGTMRATWFDGSAREFIQASRTGYANGVNVTHFLGGSLVEVAGDHAVAQTKMSITQRLMHDGQEIDVICTGRFVDFFRNLEGGWGLDHRQVIYENDRIAAVVPGAPIVLDQAALAAFPPGYRHLAYFQTKAGMSIAKDLPGRTGPEVDALLARAAAWIRPNIDSMDIRR